MVSLPDDILDGEPEQKPTFDPTIPLLYGIVAVVFLLYVQWLTGFLGEPTHTVGFYLLFGVVLFIGIVGSIAVGYLLKLGIDRLIPFSIGVEARGEESVGTVDD